MRRASSTITLPGLLPFTVIRSIVRKLVFRRGNLLCEASIVSLVTLFPSLTTATIQTSDYSRSKRDWNYSKNNDRVYKYTQVYIRICFFDESNEKKKRQNIRQIRISSKMGIIKNHDWSTYCLLLSYNLQEGSFDIFLFPFFSIIWNMYTSSLFVSRL